MHPTIAHDLVKAHTSDLHRQAQHDAPGLAARRARHAPAKNSTTLMMSAHTTAALIRRVLTLLGARRASPAP